MDQRRWREKLIVTLCGSLMLLYCVLVLAYVATVPDLRLRVLLADDDRSRDQVANGVVIRDVSGMLNRGSDIVAGDILLRIGNQPIHSFGDFAQTLRSLRRPVTRDGLLKAGDDPSRVREPLPSLVEIEDGPRLVEVEFRHGDLTQTSWLVVQSLPLSDILLTFVWFILQLGITAVGALAVWHRPFDRPARLFYAMCIVTMGAFVGGFHWWVVASSLWLNVPFVACAVCVPVVSLHFFLTYPRRTWPLTTFPRVALTLLYSVPVIGFVWMVGMLGYTEWLRHSTSAEVTETLAECMKQLRDGIYVFMTFAAGCFLVMLGALALGYLRTANPIERNQLKWMFWGGVSAVIPVGYTLYLALFDRVEFALGRARLTMFLASLSFMLAYAVAILRYKLMLIDQIVSKGMRYYAASLGLTGTFAGLIAVGSLTASAWGSGGPVFPELQQAFFLGAVLAVAVASMVWGRDRLQQLIDRRFYREKYQLDKALQRMNRAVEHVVDRETLAHRMIGSCRDVLRADRVAVYLRDAGRPSFQLIAVEGGIDLPSQIVFDDDLMALLLQESAIARSVTAFGSGSTSAQQALRLLRAELMYAFESDGDIAGMVVLGPKQNGAAYSAEDLTFLNALGQITNVALHSVKVHQDLSRVNEEMQLKVEKIDEQRRVISMLQQEIKTTQGVDLIPKAEPPAEEFRRGQIKGNSPAIQRVLETVRKVAQSESSVLVTGASGTGKELLAHAIHQNSARRNGPIVSVHCAALSPSLLESELFGHVKGAFTGAHKDRLGRFESANSGTLFLDEIGDISLETQIKLLRVLQTREFEAVGGTRTVKVDVRLIAATNQDLKKLITEGKFREDLFYRLNVISIALPTLAERKEDILELALYFLKKCSEKLGKQLKQIDDDTLVALKRHSWPGNIRELENVIERAVVLAEGETITIHDLPNEVLTKSTQTPRTHSSRSVAVNSNSMEPPPSKPEPVAASAVRFSRDDLNEFAERETLEQALRASSGNKAEAARMLGMPRSTFFSKLRKHRINKPR
ncbi:MAG: sigma 54-interacting transcriptional regulator [Planctomycetia bacterium]|nr:sigma 54-interacting transcriptional regulator [Planctomycetia bacterium]